MNSFTIMKLIRLSQIIPRDANTLNASFLSHTMLSLKMFSTKVFYLSCCYFTVGVVALKTWIPRTNLNEKRNWNILDLPKNCDHVFFDVSNDLSLLWTFTDLLVSGLTLPQSGTLMFMDNMSLLFKDRKSCQGARDIKYIRNEWKGWLDPRNWEYQSGGMWLPHAERIPCIDEDVKFPSSSSFAVRLPSIMVPIGKILFGDEEYDGDEWGDFLNTGLGIRQFSREQIVQNSWVYDMGCPGKQKCICGSSPYVFQNRNYKFVDTFLLHKAICMYAKQNCKPIECYSPVIPEGHCCGLCGALIKLKDPSLDDEFLNRIREKVRQLKMSSSPAVGIHVGRTIDRNVEVAVISESQNHASDALALGTLVKDYLAAEKVEILSVQFSGLNLSSYLFNSTTGVVFGTLFAVLLFFAAIYFIYVILPERNITGEHPFRFARFKNVLSEDGSEENLEIGTEVEPQTEGLSNSTFTDIEEPGISNPDPHEEEDPDQQTRQEYNNPTYHEMEKTTEFRFFEVKCEDEENEKQEQFSEIDL